MGKIGNTSPLVFSILGQLCMYPELGFKVGIVAPRPDAPCTSSITFYVSMEEEDIEIESTVKESLRATARMTNALVTGVPTIEYLPVQGDEEVKFTVTIWKNHGHLNH